MSPWVNSSTAWGGSAGLSDPARPAKGGGCRGRGGGKRGHLCGSAQPRATNKMLFEESYGLEVASSLMLFPGE